MSFLELSGPSGLIQREFLAEGFTQAVIDRELMPGLYVIRSWQRPCNANCGGLDAAANECTASFVLESGHASFVTATFTPGDENCSLVETSAAPPSSIPDAVSLRADFPSCDYAYYVYPNYRPVRPALNCFNLANEAGEEAEFRSSIVSEDGTDSRDHAIFRTHTDRRIEVFRRVGSEAGSTWLHYTCARLLPGAPFRREAVPENCSEPRLL